MAGREFNGAGPAAARMRLRIGRRRLSGPAGILYEATAGDVPCWLREARDASAAAEFDATIQALQALSDPGLPRVLRSGSRGGLACALLSAPVGDAFFEWTLLRPQVSEALAAADQLCRTVVALHRGGLVHGDLRAQSLRFGGRAGPVALLDTACMVPCVEPISSARRADEAGLLLTCACIVAAATSDGSGAAAVQRAFARTLRQAQASGCPPTALELSVTCRAHLAQLQRPAVAGDDVPLRDSQVRLARVHPLPAAAKPAIPPAGERTPAVRPGLGGAGSGDDGPEPAAGPPSVASADPAPGAPHPRPGQTALVVDDDGVVARAMARALDELGMQVLLAEDAEQALQLLLGSAQTISLVVSDLRMPGFDGAQLLSELASQGVSPRVLLVSGDSPSVAVQPRLRTGEVEFLAKPFDTETFLESVTRLLV